MLAGRKKRQAVRAGRFISMFPYVRFVGISGSLSKGYADEKSDFDFFIVAENKRLWICRTLLHLFKKITFLAGQQDKFCMNYFIDTHDLRIEEQNRYTAIELASLIPVSGYDIYIKLEQANQWVNNFLPNGYIGFCTGIDTIDDHNGYLKMVLEAFLDKADPEKWNARLMKITDNKWRKKWSRRNYPMDDYDSAFKTTLHISKNHPANHQKKVLEVISQIQD